MAASIGIADHRVSVETANRKGCRKLLASCDMKTLYLRNVPDDVSAALDELASAESMSVSALAVRELAAAVAFRRNADIIWSTTEVEIGIDDIVDEVRRGRDR